MAIFAGRMTHPKGPIPFPEDPMESRDPSQDPRSVQVLANNEDQARELLEKYNPGFEIIALEELPEGLS